MPTSKENYDAYLREYVCKEPSGTGCLYETSYTATRSDGRKVKVGGVYAWRDVNAPADVFITHFLVQYMKNLRNAYADYPEIYHQQLYNQTDFIVSKAIDRNGALVWENHEGYAQGMEQAEYAYLFSSIASVYKQKNEIKLARNTLTFALRLSRAFNIQVGKHTGGVCSITTYGGSKRARFRPCFWFHSKGVGINDGVKGERTVLNQHLHVIRDLLYMYLVVQAVPDLVDSQFGTATQVLAYLEDRAIGGLYQLVFTEGHKPGVPYRPPNIRQFMNHKTGRVAPTPEHPDGNPLSYYFAHYEYNMRPDQENPVEKPATLCWYHTHVLEITADIKNILDENRSVFNSTENGWRLYEAMEALLAGKGEPTGIEGSKNAIYQFYRSEGPAYKIRREQCSQASPLSEYAQTILASVFD